MACDVARYCTDDAVFSIKETDLGIVASAYLELQPCCLDDLQPKGLAPCVLCPVSL